MNNPHHSSQSPLPLGGVGGGFLVTIAIPAYKATYLEESLRSAVNQTYENIEIVVVNDHSPYDITPIVESFHDERIRYYINEENIGGKDLVAQWNKCLSYAQGEYFCLLCDDDIYDPQFVETMLQLAEQYPDVDVFRARMRKIDNEGKTIDLFPASPSYETAYDYMWHFLRGYRSQTVSEFMLRTSHVKETGGYYSLPRAWGSDSLSVFLFAMDKGIASCNSLLASFRQSDENISFNFKDDAREKMQAAELYRKKCLELIAACKDEDLKTMLKKAEPENYNKRVLYILNMSKLSSFLWIIFHHHVGIKLLLNSCFSRIAMFLHPVTAFFRRH